MNGDPPDDPDATQAIPPGDPDATQAIPPGDPDATQAIPPGGAEGPGEAITEPVVLGGDTDELPAPPNLAPDAPGAFGPTAGMAAGAEPVAGRARGGRPWLVAGLVALLVVLLGIGAWALARDDGGGTPGSTTTSTATTAATTAPPTSAPPTTAPPTTAPPTTAPPTTAPPTTAPPTTAPPTTAPPTTAPPTSSDAARGRTRGTTTLPTFATP